MVQATSLFKYFLFVCFWVREVIRFMYLVFLPNGGAVLGMEPRTPCMLSIHSTTELYLPPFFKYFSMASHPNQWESQCLPIMAQPSTTLSSHCFSTPPTFGHYSLAFTLFPKQMGPPPTSGPLHTLYALLEITASWFLALLFKAATLHQISN